MLNFLKKKKDAQVPAVAEGAAEGADATPAKKKPPLLLILIPAAVLVLGGAGAGAYFLFLKPKPAEAQAGGHAAPPPAEKGGGHRGGAAGAEGVGTIASGPDGVTFFTLPDMVVNIQSADGRPTFLKLTLTLEMQDPHLASTLQAEAPRLQDMLQGFLRELRPDDLAGSAGSHQLRMEILRRVNLIAAPGEVNAVLIEEMLVQ